MVKFSCTFHAPPHSCHALARPFHAVPRRRFLAGAACLCCPDALGIEPRRAKASLLLDATAGSVLAAHRADEPHAPASLVKIMTLYALFDALAQGTLLLSDRVTISETAAGQPPLRLGLEAGEYVSVSDAIGALATRSANDVACAVAERLGASEVRFAAWMNAKARWIGMRATLFVNASGLPDDDQQSTARDISVLGARIWSDHARYCDWFGRRSYRFSDRDYAAHTEILSEPLVVGAKTGYTHAAGYNLIAWARRAGHLLVGVVLGEDSAAERDTAMASLLASAR